MRKWALNLHKHFSKENRQTANRHKKGFKVAYLQNESKNPNEVSSHMCQMALIKLQLTHAGEDVEKRENPQIT